jgi:hypothetical protein
MNRPVNERLMTVEEALQLSQLNADPREKFERPSIWAWQTVARAMAQTVTDEQIDSMCRRRRKPG